MKLWDRIGAALDGVRQRTLGAFLETLASAKARRDETAFSIALIALSAKMARADGVVTDEEIAAFRDFFEFPEAEAGKVRMIYDLAQQDVAGFDHYLARVARVFEDEPAVLEMQLLDDAAARFGVSASAARRIKAAHTGGAADDPYLILGVDPGADDGAVKAAWRALVRDHHPDALAARGVPESLLKIAEGRTAAVNAAYDAVMKERRRDAM